MLSCQKDKFSLPEDSHYLNCAYMSPMLKSVEKAGIETICLKRNPISIKPIDFFSSSNALREEFAHLISAKSLNSVAIIPSVSYGIANAANNIPLSTGDEIVILGEQFPSNVYIWKEKAKVTGATVRTIHAPENTDSRAEIWNKNILESINDKTKVVAMGHVHWTDGTLFDLKAISQKVHSHDGYLIVDGTQSVGALPFDVNDIQPDALICAGYKWLLGPYGIGLGYYNDRFQNGDPIEYSWISRLDSEDFAGLVNYQDQYQPGAQRYDGGERSSFINVAMQLEGLKQINHWGVSNIQKYCEIITERAIGQLSEMGFKIEHLRNRGSHLFGVRLSAAQDLQKIAELLAEKKVSVSVRGLSVRVAPNVYNTEDDSDILVECLKEIA